LSTNISVGYGVFHLVNICGDRLVVQNGSVTNIMASPNPSESYLNLSFESTQSGECKIEIFNAIGLCEFKKIGVPAQEGKNQVVLGVNNLKSGLYNLMIKQGESVGSVRILVVK
jgi:hypothetical protein